jgi:hypothetical protein
LRWAKGVRARRRRTAIVRLVSQLSKVKVGTGSQGRRALRACALGV